MKFEDARYVIVADGQQTRLTEEQAKFLVEVLQEDLKVQKP